MDQETKLKQKMEYDKENYYQEPEFGALVDEVEV